VIVFDNKFLMMKKDKRRHRRRVIDIAECAPPPMYPPANYYRYSLYLSPRGKQGEVAILTVLAEGRVGGGVSSKDRKKGCRSNVSLIFSF
jgi:hypothetical protein